MKVICLLLCFSVLVSCKNYEKIDRLEKQIEAVNSQIIEYKNHALDHKSTMQNMIAEKNRKFFTSSSLKNQTEDFIRNYPMASAYIYEFDKEPIDILWQYVEAKTEEEQDRLLFTHIALQIYYNIGHNADTVSYARQVFNEFDMLKSQCLASIDSLTTLLTLYETEIQNTESKIALLQQQQENFTAELKKENE